MYYWNLFRKGKINVRTTIDQQWLWNSYATRCTRNTYLTCSSILGYGLSAWFIDGDFFLGLFVIIIAIIGVCGGYVSLTQLNKKAEQIKTIQKGHVEDYYKLTKDGKAIKFTLKDSKSDMLQKQAEAKIIDEDSKTYQVQYKNTIDRVPKSAVK